MTFSGLEIQLANAADVDVAVESAQKGLNAWNDLAPVSRGFCYGEQPSPKLFEITR